MADMADQAANNQVVFETMYLLPAKTVRNGIALVSGSGTDGWLHAGATSATLQGGKDEDPALQPGDVLILEEVLGPESGLTADADPTHRHAVRLKSAVQEKQGDPVTVSWCGEEALPFALCLKAGVSVAARKSSWQTTAGQSRIGPSPLSRLNRRRFPMLSATGRGCRRSTSLTPCPTTTQRRARTRQPQPCNRTHVRGAGLPAAARQGNRGEMVAVSRFAQQWS